MLGDKVKSANQLLSRSVSICLKIAVNFSALPPEVEPTADLLEKEDKL